jgi:hypothetical protein
MYTQSAWCGTGHGDCKRTREFMSGFGDRLPKEISEQLDSLQQRLETTAQQQLTEHKPVV